MVMKLLTYGGNKKMKADKFTVTITVDVLSMDCVAPMAHKAINHISDEIHNGELVACDGDTVKWQTKAEAVEV
jgi:hypothetical protein